VLSVISGPPVILNQPTAVATRYLNGNATLSVVGVGAVPITYQWQFDSGPISGATGSSLVLTALQGNNAGTYNVILTNPHGSLASSNEVLTIIVPTNYPSAIMAMGPQAYWRLNETNGTTAYDYAGGYDGKLSGVATVGQPGPALPGLAGTGSSAYFFDGLSGVVTTPFLVNGDEGTFIAMIDATNIHVDPEGILDARGGPGSSCSLELYTDGVTLQYTWANQGDTYGYAPTDNLTGLKTTLESWCFVAVSVGESQTIFYFDDGTGMQTETNDVPSIAVTNTGPMLIGRDPTWFYFPGGITEGAYFNRALSPAEFATLDSALFAGTPVAAPQILTPPISQSSVAGTSASFTVSAVGALPLNYQWQLDNTNIPGATAQSLVIPSVSSSDGGSYRVVVSNSVGSTSSTPALLTVSTAPGAGSVVSGLVGHYKFDGDFTDSSGHNNNGTGINSPAFVTGLFGSAVEVGNYVTLGMDQCVNLGYPPDMQFNYGDTFTVAWWIDYSNAIGDLPMIGTAISSTYQPGWTFADSYYDDGGGNMEISFATGTGDYTAQGPYPIDDGHWHHVAVTADLVNLVSLVYIDGVPVTNYFLNGKGTARTTIPIPSAGTPATVYPGYPIVIGSDPTAGYGGNSPGAYAIDDLGIWNRLLSAAEVSSIYATGTNGQPLGSGTQPIELVPTLLSAGHLQLSWSAGTLESAPELTGPWTPVAGATPPTYVATPGDANVFYRVH
jgi:hypothetical protein